MSLFMLFSVLVDARGGHGGDGAHGGYGGRGGDGGLCIIYFKHIIVI